MDIRDHDEVALDTGVADIEVTLKAEDKTLRSRYLNGCVKDEHSWILVARQTTCLPEKNNFRGV